MAVSRTVAVVLMEIQKLPELKRNTDVTKNVLLTIQSLIDLQNEEKKCCFSRLLTDLRKSYLTMIQQVKRYKLLATKIDKLIVLFHQFSVREGYKICKDSEITLI